MEPVGIDDNSLVWQKLDPGRSTAGLLGVAMKYRAGMPWLGWVLCITMASCESAKKTTVGGGVAVDPITQEASPYLTASFPLFETQSPPQVSRIVLTSGPDGQATGTLVLSNGSRLQFGGQEEEGADRSKCTTSVEMPDGRVKEQTWKWEGDKLLLDSERVVEKKQ